MSELYGVIENNLRQDSRIQDYDNAIKFYNFSKEHEDWAKQINRDNMGDITDYYNRVIQWYNSII